MQSIEQQIIFYFQQISASVPGIPTSMLIFFLVVAGFLTLVLFFLILRILWTIIDALFGFTRRKRARHGDPQWERTMRLQALRQQHHWQREDYWEF